MRQIAPRVKLPQPIKRETLEGVDAYWDLPEAPQKLYRALNAAESAARALGSNALDDWHKLHAMHECKLFAFGVSYGFYETEFRLTPSGVEVWNPAFWEGGLEDLCPAPVVVKWNDILNATISMTALEDPEIYDNEDDGAEFARNIAKDLRALAEKLDALAHAVDVAVAKRQEPPNTAA